MTGDTKPTRTAGIRGSRVSIPVPKGAVSGRTKSMSIAKKIALRLRKKRSSARGSPEPLSPTDSGAGEGARMAYRAMRVMELGREEEAQNWEGM